VPGPVGPASCMLLSPASRSGGWELGVVRASGASGSAISPSYWNATGYVAELFDVFFSPGTGTT